MRGQSSFDARRNDILTLDERGLTRSWFEEEAMAKLTRKLWVGIGVASLAGAASLPRDIAAQDLDHKAHGTPPATQNDGPNPKSADPKPGEGGEAYLTDGGPRDTRIRFYRD